MINYLLPAAIAVVLFFAIRSLIKKRKNGCAGCTACANHKQCDQSCSTDKDAQ